LSGWSRRRRYRYTIDGLHDSLVVVMRLMVMMDYLVMMVDILLMVVVILYYSPGCWGSWGHTSSSPSHHYVVVSSYWM
jgi:hypothetical protein